MASLKINFGRVVRRLRGEAGYSQESFADAIGLNRTYMGTLERGKGNPTLQIIEKIARGLRVSVSVLFETAEKESG